MIAEDFTGLPAANSYASLADANTFHQDRGNTDWSDATDDERASALIRATDYIEQAYQAKGRPLKATQALQWPTAGNQGANGLVKRVVMLLALEALSNDLNPRIERGSLRQLDKLDGLGMTETFFDTSPIYDHYPHVTAMLRGIATPRRSSVTSGRVSRHPPFDPAVFDVLDGFGGNGFNVFDGWDFIE